jgi:small subunit ribosomal protein S16
MGTSAYLQFQALVVNSSCWVGRRPDLLALSVSWCGGTLKIKGNIMVVIRLARGGSKKRPFYNIVVANSQQRRDGRFIEKVGFYNPVASGAAESLRVATDRVAYWTGVGAQLSPTVARLVDQAKKAVAA